MVNSWGGLRQGRSWTWWSLWVPSNWGYYTILWPKIADAVTAISHWSQMQDLCLDLSLVAFFKFYFYLKSVLTGMNPLKKKKSLSSGLILFTESPPYSSDVPQGSCRSIYICLEEKWRLQIFKVVFSHPHSKGKQTHASNIDAGIFIPLTALKQMSL